MLTKRQPVKVLIISPFFRPSIGGVETHLTDLTEHLRKRNYRVFVSTYTPNITGLYERKRKVPIREAKKNLDVHRIRWFGNGLFFSLADYAILEFLYLVPAMLFYDFIFLCYHKIDVINAHGLVAAFVARILSAVFKIRSVMSVHVVYNFKNRLFLRTLSRWTVSSFDKILTLSETSKKDFEDLDIPREKISIYTHWVDQDVFKPPLQRDDVREKLGFRNYFTVLFVGKLYKTKGIDVLLEAAKMLPTDIKIVIIGSGPMEAKIRELAQNNKRVLFVGRVSLNRLVEYYGAADVFIIPSVTSDRLTEHSHDEGFARVVVEALSCGTPVIVSNVGCLPDTIDKSVGRVVNPTAGEISKVILHFYENPGELRIIKQNCRPYALKRYSEKNAAEIEEILVEPLQRVFIDV